MNSPKERTVYVQRREGRTVETVDQFPYNTREERKEAQRCRDEYNLSDPTAAHYLSRRACKGWNDEPTIDDVFATLGRIHAPVIACHCGQTNCKAQHPDA